MNSSIDFNSEESRLLLRNLYAYARRLFTKLYKSEVNERGKSFSDYVNDTIERHLMGQDPYDPSKSPLEYHLKKNVLRRLIYNDLPSHVKRARVPNYEMSESTPMVKMVSPARPEPAIESTIMFDQQLIMTTIEKEIGDDNVVGGIYLAVCHDDFNLSDRAEICQEVGLTTEEFNNGRRRFLTIAKRVYKTIYNI
jgi:hypothetical protein